MTTGKVLLGVLGGVAAGALLGVLFAPDKGVETRKKIARKKDDYTGAIKDKFNSFVDGISSTLESTKDEVSSLVDKGRDLAEKGRERMDHTAGRVENVNR